MILYFSGTGNSRWVATQLGKELQEQACSMADWLKDSQYTYSMKKGEQFGVVFPVYGWGMPLFVERFLQRLELKGQTAPMVYMVCTCGDDIGLTDKDFVSFCEKKGWNCHSCFSVQMPNTYVCLPSFDVDDAVLQSKKIAAADEKIRSIARKIEDHREGLRDVVPGSMPWMKSRVLKPLFNRFLVTDRFFSATDACVGCGACVKSCPLGNIVLEENRPKWKGDCTGCLSCYHHCLTHAIRFGKMTEGKGRYIFHEKSAE